MKQGLRHTIGLLVATVLVAGLAACNADTPTVPEETTQPAPSQSEPATPPEPSDTPETTQPEQPAVVLPECDAIDLDALHEGTPGLVAAEIPVSDVGAHTFGPIALAAAEDALQARGCSIYLPNSGYAFSMLFAELDEDPREELVGALDGSDFTREETQPGVSYFRHIVNNEDEGWFSYVIHAFEGNLWIAETGGGMGAYPPDLGPSEFVLAFLNEARTAP